jgi:small subunit ribosomal protein S6
MPTNSAAAETLARPKALAGPGLFAYQRASPRRAVLAKSFAVQDPSFPAGFRRRTRRLPQRKKETMALYEHVVISRQDISPQQAEALNDQLKHLIEEGGGNVAKIEYWGLRNLTYRIKKNRKGHYSLLAIDAPADVVKEMERQLSINEDVLRFMTVRVDELDLELSPILARRDGERERRDDGRQF